MLRQVSCIGRNSVGFSGLTAQKLDKILNSTNFKIEEHYDKDYKLNHIFRYEDPKTLTSAYLIRNEKITPLLLKSKIDIYNHGAKNYEEAMLMVKEDIASQLEYGDKLAICNDNDYSYSNTPTGTIKKAKVREFIEIKKQDKNHPTCEMTFYV